MIRTTYPVWTDINDVPAQYPWLDNDAACDVCVVGGGITGVMCAMFLAQSGADTILIAENRIGAGAVASAMPCVQYDFGRTFHSSRRVPGSAEILMRLGAQSLSDLERLVPTLDGDCGFALRDLMIFTSDPSELALLGSEYTARREAGFDCTFVSRETVRDVFPFEIAGAIVSKRLAAELDPYRLTHLCAKEAAKCGARIYENTRADNIDFYGGENYIDTSTRRVITAKKTVIATGTAAGDLLGGRTARKTCFLTASAPCEKLTGWHGRCVLRTWETPGITVAASPGGRIFSGGLATSSVSEDGRLYGVLPLHRLCNKRFDELEELPLSLFPDTDIDGFDYACVSSYCETADMLPIIGALPEAEGCVFALCSAPDAALMSLAAADIAARICLGDTPPDAEIYSPERDALRR